MKGRGRQHQDAKWWFCNFNTNCFFLELFVRGFPPDLCIVFVSTKYMTICHNNFTLYLNHECFTHIIALKHIGGHHKVMDHLNVTSSYMCSFLSITSNYFLHHIHPFWVHGIYRAMNGAHILASIERGLQTFILPHVFTLHMKQEKEV